jgi:ComF family protein
MLAGAANALIRILFAPSCAGCARVLARPLAGVVCDACWREVAAITPPWCECCGDALPSWRVAGPLCARCRRRPPAFTRARSAGQYDGALRELLQAFKYGGRRALARPLAERLAAAGADMVAAADALVPVPLHPWRRLRRGFNQADDLAAELSRVARLPVWRALGRTRHGPPQAGLPAARRHANVRAAFVVRGRRRYDHVLLIDDVMTTGATLDACGRALAAAGVKVVWALTVARAATPPRRGPPAPLRPSDAPRR